MLVLHRFNFLFFTFLCSNFRWDVNFMDHLPDYMKLCFFVLFNSINEIAYDILRDQGVDSLPYLKKTVIVFFYIYNFSDIFKIFCLNFSLSLFLMEYKIIFDAIQSEKIELEFVKFSGYIS